MNRILLGALVLLVAAFGCGDEQSPLTPGDVNDPDFEMFMTQFESIDQGTGLMVDAMFDIVDGVINSNPENPPTVIGAYEVNLEYDDLNDEWVGTFTASDSEAGFALSVTNRIQFIDGGVAVQYPDEATLDRVSSSLSMEVTGEGIENMSGYQDLTLDLEHQAQDILLTINGTGGWAAAVSFTEPGQTTGTTCDISMDFGMTARNIQMYASQAGSSSEGSCPIAGSMSYSGSADIGCTGENTASVTGSWSVSRSFQPNGNMHTRVVHGGNIWEADEACS
jgi:hypothetical protein